jgi:sugar/nucleoside kinase (ribokinase family)
VTDSGKIVVVIGDVMNDVVVDPLGPVFPDSDTVSRIRRVAGGSGANQAAWLGYLGVRCRFIGRVGRNDADRHRSAFVAAFVEPMLAVDDEVDTGTVVSVVGADRRSMYSDRGANARLGPADLPDTALADAGLLHLSGYVLFAEPSRTAVIEFRDRAVRRGCAVSVDPSSESLLRAAGPESFLAATAGADLCFPNVDEARALSDRADPVDAARALTAYYGTVIVTLGPAGCVVAQRDVEPLVVAAPKASIVDPTGAGDAFSAAYLRGWLDGADPQLCARNGVEAGARCAGRIGGRPPVDRVAG